MTYKRPYREVMPVAQHLLEKLAPFCHDIMIAGSLRRQREVIGDIEIVALPRRQPDLFGGDSDHSDQPTWLDMFLAEKLPGSAWIKNGRKYKQFMYGRYQVDLFLPESAAHWGCISLIRTGSHEFNLWLMGEAQRAAGVQFKDGRLWRGGEVLATPDEESVFEALGLPYILPNFRDDKDWLNLLEKKNVDLRTIKQN